MSLSFDCKKFQEDAGSVIWDESLYHIIIVIRIFQIILNPCSYIRVLKRVRDTVTQQIIYKLKKKPDKSSGSLLPSPVLVVSDFEDFSSPSIAPGKETWLVVIEPLWVGRRFPSLDDGFMCCRGPLCVGSLPKKWILPKCPLNCPCKISSLLQSCLFWSYCNLTLTVSKYWPLLLWTIVESEKRNPGQFSS